MEGSENEASLKVLDQALSHMNSPSDLSIYIDSKWLHTALTEWLPKWRNTEYLSAKGEPIAFAETWQKVDEALKSQNFTVFLGENHSYKNWMERNIKPA